MANTIVGPIVTMAAAGDSLGIANAAEASNDFPLGPIYVKWIMFDSSDASADGQFAVLTKSGGARIVPDYDYTTAGNEPPATFAVEGFVEGVYVAGIPTGGRVIVYHGRV